MVFQDNSITVLYLELWELYQMKQKNMWNKFLEALKYLTCKKSYLYILLSSCVDFSPWFDKTSSVYITWYKKLVSISHWLRLGCNLYYMKAKYNINSVTLDFWKWIVHCCLPPTTTEVQLHHTAFYTPTLIQESSWRKQKKTVVL